MTSQEIRQIILTGSGLMMKLFATGLQSPSARNPTIEQKIELLTFMEDLGMQKVDLGLPGAGPFHLEHIEATKAAETASIGNITAPIRG